MTEDGDAAGIIKKMGEAYANLESYKDQGYVETIYRPGTDRSRTSRLSFTTQFRRPNLFLFEWTSRFFDDSPERHYAVWCDGKRAYEKYPNSSSKRVSYPLCFPNATRDIGLAVAGATGVSNSAAHNVSALVMSEVGGTKITDLPRATYICEDNLDNEVCHRIRGARQNGHTHLWISEARNIILKITEDYVVKPSADPLAHLEDNALKSIEGFMEWLMFGGLASKYLRKRAEKSLNTEDFSVHSDTLYQQIEINVPIPVNTFTEPRR